MTKPSFRAPLTQADFVIRLSHPFFRILRVRHRRTRASLLRARAMEKRLCRPIFRRGSAMFWLGLEYRHVVMPGWSRIRLKLLDVGRLTGRRVSCQTKAQAPFRERFETWAEQPNSVCRGMGHDWQEDGDEPGSWACARCEQETTRLVQPPLHLFLSPLSHGLGIERYLEWCRKWNHGDRLAGYINSNL